MKLVLIEWVDSHSGQGWRDIGGIADTCRPLHCKSVGWLAADTNGCKVVVPHIYSESNDGIARQGCGDLVIPNKAIIKLRVLSKC